MGLMGLIRRRDAAIP